MLYNILQQRTTIYDRFLAIRFLPSALEARRIKRLLEISVKFWWNPSELNCMGFKEVQVKIGEILRVSICHFLRALSASIWGHGS